MEVGYHIPTFHIPDSNLAKFNGDRQSAQVSHQTLFLMGKVGVGRELPIVTFENVTILTPRGQFTVEVYLSFLRMQQEGNAFEIPYSSILEIFALPKCRRPYTFVVITLDPSVSKCQTFFPHIVIQFQTDYVVEKFLVMNQELYSAIYEDKLKPSYEGLIHEVFIAILQGLYSLKLTKPGEFRSYKDGYAVDALLEVDDGLFYPLEKCFFFLPEAPTVIYHDDIQYVKFERDARAGPNNHYFDLLIKLKTHQEHLFQAIPSEEYNNLFSFISSKGLHEEQLALSSF